ncbi:MAG TPA: DolP-mannose mannosyltransferase [Blastocatellia bacterium]|nr:DolP-mannose mannosyltransferase [Blastocatellia bacterium]
METHRPLNETDALSHQSGWITRIANVRVLALAAFLVGGAVVLADRPFTHAERGDSSIFDYIAQSIVRGQVPYRDVIDLKGPGSMYLSAGAIAIGRFVGMRDIIAVRWSHVFLMGLLATITFLVADAYFENRLASILAVLIPFMTSSFSSQVIRGTQPKLPMILFGMVSLLLVARNKPFWAGSFSMLSCLCWQPGLMFTGVAVLIFSRYLTTWRDSRALKVMLGAAVPLCVVLVYFSLKGAIGDLWSWTIVYPYRVFAPETSMPLRETFDNFWAVMHRELLPFPLIAPLALAGLVIYVAARVVRIITREEEALSANLFRDAVVFPPLIYLTFCMINFQSAPDLIPFYPFIGLFGAWLIVEAGRLAGTAWLKLATLAPLAAMLAIIAMIVIEHTREPGDGALPDQDREAQIVASYLGLDDKIFSHGMAQVLVLLNKPNVTKYLTLADGTDNYIAAHKPGGFQDVIDEIEMSAPKIIAISRLRNVRHRVELEDWIDQHYDKLQFANLDGIYIRKR